MSPSENLLRFASGIWRDGYPHRCGPSNYRPSVRSSWIRHNDILNAILLTISSDGDPSKWLDRDRSIYFVISENDHHVVPAERTSLTLTRGISVPEILSLCLESTTMMRPETIRRLVGCPWTSIKGMPGYHNSLAGQISCQAL